MFVGERCDVCGASARGLCDECRGALERPVVPNLGPELDQVITVFSYCGAGANLLQTLKYRNRRTSVDTLVDATVASSALPVAVDLIVPVPPDLHRLRTRGYDLPDLISRRLSARLGIDRSLCLVRVDSGSQQNRSRAERVNAAAYRCIRSLEGSVLLVDDVVTTGATAKTCASSLRLGGARTVHLFALAATPPSPVSAGAPRFSRVKP